MLLGVTLLLSGCSDRPGGSEPTSDPSAATVTEPATSEPATPDPALAAACAEFWGDPDYVDPLSRVVLDRAGTAPDVGPSDPYFYAMTGDDIDSAFEGASGGARSAATELSDWFRSEPEKGADLDHDAFRAGWDHLAGECASVSIAATWSAEPGDDGTKPASLSCADVFDTPGTLTPFANANVLTSNMFKLVGLSPRSVPADRMEDVQATADLLAAEIAAVDDDGVREALSQVRAPFQDALDGDTWSEGLRDPLTELGTACDAAGYSSPEPGEIEDGDPAADTEGLV